MTSMNISIKGEAYDFLKSMKTHDKSFSDVILEFKAENKSALRFFGAFKDLNWKEKESSMKGLRDSFNRRLK